MAQAPTSYDATVTMRRVVRLRATVAVLTALLMLAVPVGFTLLMHLSDPLAAGYTTADRIVFVVAAFSGAVFVAAGVVAFRGRAGKRTMGIVEAVLWLDMVVIAGSVVVLLVAGSVTAAVWISAIALGFDLVKGLRFHRLSN